MIYNGRRPARDTNEFMFLQGLGGRVIPGVSRLTVCPDLSE